jgi:hypothetical protein
MKNVARSFSIAIALAGLTPMVACSEITNTTAVQCLSEEECLAKGPAFAKMTCSPVTKTCVPVESAGGTCKTNQECIDANGGAPSICRKSDRTCRLLTSPQCATVVGDEYANDNAIVVGGYTVSNALAGTGERWENIIRLVQHTFVTQVNGVPDPAGGPPRPVVYVLCQEFNNGKNGLLLSAKHLVEELQVPTLMAPFDEGSILSVLQQEVIPNGGLVIAPISPTTAFRNLPGNQFAPTPNYWRTSGSDESMTTVMAAALSDGGVLQKRALDSGLISAFGNVKMLMVVEDSVLGQSWAQRVLSRLTLNGVAGGDATHLRVVSAGRPIVDPVFTPDPLVAGNQAVQAAIGGTDPYLPDIVVYVSGTPYLAPYVLLPLEAQWPTDKKAKPIEASMAIVMTQVLPPDPELMTRLFFTDYDPPADTPERQARLDGFHGLYNTYIKPKDPYTKQQAFIFDYNLYDAYFMSQLALAAVGSNPITPANIAVAMSKFASNGTQVNDDPQQVSAIISAVSSGQPVTINGLGGLIDLDPNTAAPRTGGALFCPHIDPALGAVYPVPSGFSLPRGTNKSPSGELDPGACPLAP